jgi:hypothetical protein
MSDGLKQWADRRLAEMDAEMDGDFGLANGSHRRAVEEHLYFLKQCNDKDIGFAIAELEVELRERNGHN